MPWCVSVCVYEGENVCIRLSIDAYVSCVCRYTRVHAVSVFEGRNVCLHACMCTCVYVCACGNLGACVHECICVSGCVSLNVSM